MRTAFVALVAALLVGCSAYHLPPNSSLSESDFRAHVLMFDARGEPRDPLTEAHGTNAYLRAEHTPKHAFAVSSYDDYMQHILDGIEAHRAKQPDKRVKVLLFFHGGLNTRKQAMERAEREIQLMRRPESEGGRPDVYPIFIAWQSSLSASYRNHLLFVTKGQDTYTIGALLAPFKLANDIIRFVLELAPDNGLQAVDYWRRQSYKREGIVQAENCPVENLDFREGTRLPRTFWGDRKDHLAAFTTYLLGKWWTTGVIDAGGKPAWSSMLYTIDRLFYSDQEMHHQYRFKTRDAAGAGDFSEFLRRLSKCLYKGQDEVILVGHSAGAIVANAIVGNFGDRLPITKLVYLAPACTIDELMNGGRIADFLTADKRRQLYILTLHEIAEFSEKSLFDFTPRGTLLIWLDEFIQPKNSEFRGHMMGRAKNLRLHAHLIPCDVQRQVHITAFSERPTAPPVFHPQSHSDVGRIEYWREELWRPDDPQLKKVCVTDDPQKLFDPETASGDEVPRCTVK
jgi:pimeloyl-ACP methyl ester carboxylesterase